MTSNFCPARGRKEALEKWKENGESEVVVTALVRGVIVSRRETALPRLLLVEKAV